MNRLVLVDADETAIEGTHPKDTREVEPGVYSVLLNGKSFQVRIAPERVGFTVDLMGQRFKTEVRDPRNASRHSRTATAGGVQTVSASMPGKVIRVLVEQGQQVEVGQGLIVVEAMKMQNEMKATKPGRVAQVHTKDGSTVTAGDVLVTIE